MDRKEMKDSVKNAGLAGANSEIVQKYGSAISEHLKAYSGMDNERKEALSKGLKQISQSRVDPDNVYRNIKQQAGFSAEVKTVARENAEKIISGNQTSRSIRTDDMSKQVTEQGHGIGGRNDQLFDIAEVDKMGGYIEGSGRQLKYVGGNPKECTQKLLEKKFDKYREADIPMEVPSNFYTEVQLDLTERISKVEKQIASAEARGDARTAANCRERLEKLEATKRNLRKGNLTNEEAIQARLHPQLSTAKDISKLSHRAGVKAAEQGAVIGGSISLLQNSVAVIKGDKPANEAIADVFGDTIKSSGSSYLVGYAGAAIKGAMQNAPSQYLQTLSKTNLPATIVTTAIEVGKTLSKYASGEIDGTECLTELGEKGTGMLAASAGAAVGQVVIPIPIVGALVGSMAGYAMSSAYYNSLVGVLNDAKLAHEERLRIEAECKESIEVIRNYRIEIELTINNYLKDHIQVFSDAFNEMELAYALGDADQFIRGVNSITRKLGGDPMFDSQEEFDLLMNSSQTFKL